MWRGIKYCRNTEKPETGHNIMTKIEKLTVNIIMVIMISDTKYIMNKILR